MQGVVPPLAGLHVRLLDLGKQIRIENRSGADVVVLGYDGEPYLRVGPSGAFENTRSPTLYRNTTTAGGRTRPVPPTASAAAAPEWRQTSESPTVTWGDDRPRRVPSGAGVGRWEIPVVQGADRLSILGTVQQTSGRTPWVSLIAAAALGLIVFAAARGQFWGPVLSGFVAILVATDVVHAVALAAYSSNGTAQTVTRLLTGSYLSVLAWLVGIVAIVSLQRERESGLVAACFTGLVVGVLSGITDLPSITRTQLPVALPAMFVRVTIVVALGVGLGVVAAAATRLAKLPPKPTRGEIVESARP
jgi:hypothetical protein